MVDSRPVATSRHRVFFDDTCPLCRQTVRILQRLDWCRRFEWIGSRTSGAVARNHGLCEADLQRAVHVLTSKGKVHAAAGGLRFVASRLPLTMIPAGLFFLPGALGCADWVYARISRHRHRFTGSSGTGVCKSCTR